MTERKAAKAQKPRMAHRWGAPVPRMACRIALLLLGAVVMGLMFSGLSAISTRVVRILLSAVMLAGITALFFAEGLSCGMKDAAASSRAARLEKESGAVPAAEDAACWHPMKAATALILVFVLPLALAGFIALTAEPYHYTLQDLPTWLTSTYGSREDVMAPLAAYLQPEAPGIRIWIRMAVRLMEMPFIGFFPDPQKQAFALDTLSPLFLLIYPLAYLAAYCLGPRRQAALEARERKAARAAVRRQGKKKLADELTRGGGEVHYGQRRDADRQEHKRLV